jgi:hypothetical protein
MVSPEVIMKNFLKTGISNALDGSKVCCGFKVKMWVGKVL